MYWATDSLFHGLWARAFMSKFRYKQIQTFLKVSRPDTEDKTDKITKVRFLTEFIRRKCMKLWVPDQHISIDERMVANKGRYSFKQYIKDKPTKWGMKLWVLADSFSGFTCNFEIYLGKKEKSAFGLAYDVVTNLCKHLFHQGYKLFVDNFYSSVHLFKYLLSQGMSACGTIIAGRKGFPIGLRNIKQWGKNARGSMRWVREGDVAFLQWRDNKVVSMITTMHRFVNRYTFCIRRSKVNGAYRRLQIRQPRVFTDYNIHMGGVDKSDQMIGKYKALRRTSKFWKTLFYHMLDIARVNSYIMFQEFRSLDKNENVKALERPKSYAQLEFTLELIRELSNISKNMKVPLFIRNPTDVIDKHPVQPAHSEKRRNCFRCYRLEKVERKAVACCLTCKKNFCFSQQRNCLLLDHVYENDDLNDSFSVFSTHRK